MSLLIVYLLTAASLWKRVEGDRFDECKIRLERILNGTESYGPYNNETIRSSGIIYNGVVTGMNSEFSRTSRGQFLTVTTEGCRAICGKSPDWYWSSDVGLSLSIISNWVLPILALLAAFPFDSIHKSHGRLCFNKQPGRVRGTLLALVNWIGSPQLALSAILFSIYQNVVCARDAAGEPSEAVSALDGDLIEMQPPGNPGAQLNMTPTQIQARKNAYYVVSYHNEDPLELEKQEKVQQWTGELLHAMASQLRVLRRLGVRPAFLSISLFCVAYAISVFMAFGNIGDRTTTHSLAVGILISWLPILLLFAIVDRNPISAERSRILFIRWISNVEAVKKWENPPFQPLRLSFEPRPERNNVGHPHTTQPIWWAEDNMRWPEEANSTMFPLGDFIGQGREMGFNGLADAFAYAMRKELANMTATNTRDGLEGHRLLHAEHSNVAKLTQERLESRPFSYYVCALVSLTLVWWEIGMALMLSCSIPTVGVGCRAASYLLYGLLSTIPWAINAWPSRNPGNPNRWRKGFSILICVVSTLCLFFILFAAFSGVLKNCWCRGGSSQYVDFENAFFYRDKNHFNVVTFWRVAASVGAIPILLSFVVAWIMLIKMKPLCQVSVDSNLSRSYPRADMIWLS
ncbi:hypothetical protein GLAREA_03863 [Glarea lozoyensis ATCC 20868]|uniref:Uncharacterized protein n=1 Tax=Glarea lozoyensis (strain ATCC 20868 / MF5171) TaxID=1116229 RepID=S3DFX8_GLAL2|nr:uncharacterized protein GLAREA_03863 [Glarea lozoyensis ATCC 20868]EPE30896.1 hypothetical protein GLAREA_03863 [Glarea lozoyensis ATCC 20868]